MTTRTVPFHAKEYWENRFEKEEKFEWLFSWADLKQDIAPLLKPQDHILHLGCGNSHLAFDLAQDGFVNVTNVDYASNVIQQMQAISLERGFHSLTWYTADCLKDDLCDVLENQPDGFAVTIDKSLCDAIACGDDDLQTHQRQLSQQVLSVTQPSGLWISISYSSLREYTWKSPDNLWTWRREQAMPIKVPKSQNTPEGSPDVFYWIYVLRKVPTTPEP